MKNQKSKILILFLFFMFITSYELLVTSYETFAQEDLSQIREAYFKENRYSQFVDYLKDLKTKGTALASVISYNIALARYHQLKYLEESQNWDEYFDFGNDYRSQIVGEVKNTLDLTSTKESLNIYARCLLWQFYKGQQDFAEDKAREDLINSTIEYAKENVDTEPVRYVAGILSSYGNKSDAKKLYNIYAQRLIASETDDEKLKAAAKDAYQKENLSLSTMIYDAYIERISKLYPEDKLIPVLISIAKDFSYKDLSLYDSEYAEKIFKKIEQTGTRSIFDEQLRYARAYNLEKSKEYSDAKDQYIILVEDFPQTKYYDEAIFKIGLINTYILQDISGGRLYFEKLLERPIISAQVVSSMYQLGILSQWQKDYTKAKEYYLKLLEKAGSDFLETQELAKARLKELEDGLEMEYNLKAFLEASLSKEISFASSPIDLKANTFRFLKDKVVDISASPYVFETGCIAVEIKYLWSGDLGSTKPSIDQKEFSTSFSYPGTKEINLVVVTPSGIVDKSFIMLDVE